MIASNGNKVFYAASTDAFGNELHAVQLPPQLAAPVQIGNGSVQRSTVNQLVVNFSSAVTITPGAFVVQQRTVSGNSVVLTNVTTQVATSTNSNGTTRATLTFSGPLATSNGNLTDGNYVLTILGANVRQVSDNAAFDGDNDGNAGGDYVLGDEEADNFFALFGDTNGDRLVGVAEFGEFRGSFGKLSSDSGFNALFDYDGDGAVGIADFGQFRSRFGKPKFAW